MDRSFETKEEKKKNAKLNVRRLAKTQKLGEEQNLKNYCIFYAKSFCELKKFDLSQMKFVTLASKAKSLPLSLIALKQWGCKQLIVKYSWLK